MAKPKPVQRRRRRPKMCHHVIGVDIDFPGHGPDMWSIRWGCGDCERLVAWFRHAWKDAKDAEGKRA